jgi:hypothetical protein
MSITVRCDWSLSLDEAVCRSEETKMLDLCEAAKVRSEKSVLRTDIQFLLCCESGENTDTRRRAFATCPIGPWDPRSEGKCQSSILSSPANRTQLRKQCRFIRKNPGG